MILFKVDVTPPLIHWSRASSVINKRVIDVEKKGSHGKYGKSQVLSPRIESSYVWLPRFVQFTHAINA